MLGIDMVSIPRMREFVEKFGIRAMQRFLSNDEITLCQRKESLNYHRLAGFWAAKEALSKAFGCGIGKELGFLDMTISLDSKGAPHITLSTQKLCNFQAQKHFSHIALSITHEREFAIACVMLR
ncbi:holo-ACP synthase [Helicobacter sp. MIT 00-7814]|uniref:holo-ACP synthase n=1 Tax=unclassified Helicobacter TaxID=2593540 RepID=UPI000E1F34E9|nr:MULTISPECIES: holo-ACP synthase [unclassified Helicobacter]RDU57174.1 holo-ACP synthase [Helicobacter sp. MIT 00-7814]RDU57726.1 holo-ACP synthase [Helicobacter sp. MIT 99-10781]